MATITQADFNRQIDDALTRLEAASLAHEIIVQHVVRGMWPWQRRALRSVLDTLDFPYTSQSHRHEVGRRAKELLMEWVKP